MVKPHGNLYWIQQRDQQRTWNIECAMRIFTLTNSSLFVISAEAYENSLNASISKISWGLNDVQNIQKTKYSSNSRIQYDSVHISVQQRLVSLDILERSVCLSLKWHRCIHWSCGDVQSYNSSKVGAAKDLNRNLVDLDSTQVTWFKFQPKNEHFDARDHYSALHSSS